MPIGSQLASKPSVTVPYSVHRFSVAKYREMVASGILAEDDREASPHYAIESIYRPGDELPVIIDGEQLTPLQVDDLLP